MKHLRVTADVDADRAPAFFNLLANTPAISETRVLEWNTTVNDRETVLFAIDGDPSAFVEGADNAATVDTVTISGREAGATYALVVMDPLESPLFAAIRDARSRTGLIVRKPIVYRDSTMTFRVVGDPAPLQTALDETPPGLSVSIDEIESVPDEPQTAELRLSERQREALAMARDLGYYDHPREATHEDVATALGCTPQTAGEHLQKAEATLVAAALEESDPRYGVGGSPS